MTPIVKQSKANPEGASTKIDVVVQNASHSNAVPPQAAFRNWATEAYMKTTTNDAELVIRIVDEPEIAGLNDKYRGVPGPTNVLSFPFEDPPNMDTNVLGDIVICAQVVEREAKQLQRSLAAHWAHMVVHGVLHLCGYNHVHDDDARIMESLETDILRELNFPNPYES